MPGTRSAITCGWRKRAYAADRVEDRGQRGAVGGRSGEPRPVLPLASGTGVYGIPSIPLIHSCRRHAGCRGSCGPYFSGEISSYCTRGVHPERTWCQWFPRYSPTRDAAGSKPCPSERCSTRKSLQLRRSLGRKASDAPRSVSPAMTAARARVAVLPYRGAREFGAAKRLDPSCVPLPLGGLLFSFGSSVTSDVEVMVPTGRRADSL
jgi:hypothetical protein